MDNHGVNMKGKYYLETKTASAVDDTGLNLAVDQRRMIINASDDKMYYCNFSGGLSNTGRWIRPLSANNDDVPSENENGNMPTLGGSSARWERIYVSNSGSGGIYGQVRYS